MMRTLLFAALATSILALSGCTAPLGSDTYELTVSDFESDGMTATFTLTVDGPVTTETDHVGGHFWYGDEAPDQPTAAGSDGACQHTAGDLPGTYEVTCEIDAVGTVTVRGHARAYEDEETLDYWSAPQTFTATPDGDAYTLAAEDLEETAGGVAFNLTVEGPAGSTTHVGGHWWLASTDEPTAAGSDGACQHGAGDLPGTFHVTCDFQGNAQAFYRGHLRVELAGETWDYWTDEMTFPSA